MGRRAGLSAFLALALVFPVSLPGARAAGKDLGVHGRLYEIKEEDMLSYVRRKAGGIDMRALRENMTGNLERAHEKLSAVSLGVPPAEEKRTRYVDPSVNVPNPVYDLEGRIVAPAGTVNPLEHVPLSKPILFFREDQAERLLGVISEKKPVLMLTDGDVRAASSLAGRMVYRANPFILERLRIEKTPSLVTQDGLRLKVREVVLK